ncbi:MAG: FecR domain-containing protein, partial [Elusimicrobiota bacterium]
LRSRVKELGKDQAYTISTPQAVCAVRGTVFDVAVDREATVVNVVSGRVEAMELITGAKVEVGEGSYSTIVPGAAPQAPIETPEEEVIEESSSPELRNEMRENAFREMFQEISRDAVLRRAADEIKRAEYENGKALIDAAGSRVRLEEYVVREKNNAGFKYVVLNHREERFDFGQISFMFDNTLPEDLNRVTRNMFYSTEKPAWILTELISVITNTKDRVNEVAQGGDMIQDSDGAWRHYFADFTFLIKGEGKNEKELWNQELRLASGGSLYEDLVKEYSYYQGEEQPLTEEELPSGENYFHFKVRDTYDDGTWIQAEDYLIDDSGDTQKKSDISGITSDAAIRDYLYGLNFERKYTSSEFEDRNIDLVFSTKLLMDSGMLDFKDESAGTN